MAETQITTRNQFIHHWESRYDSQPKKKSYSQWISCSLALKQLGFVHFESHLWNGNNKCVGYYLSISFDDYNCSLMYFSPLISTWNSDLTCHPFPQEVFWSSWRGTGFFCDLVFSGSSMAEPFSAPAQSKPVATEPSCGADPGGSGGRKLFLLGFFFVCPMDCCGRTKSRQDILLTPASASRSLQYQQAL